MAKRDNTTMVALAIGCIIALGVIFGSRIVDRVNHQQTQVNSQQVDLDQQRIACKQVQQLRGAIVTILQNAQKAAPQNPYFKQHPDQLAQARQQYRYDLKQLPPARC